MIEWKILFDGVASSLSTSFFINFRLLLTLVKRTSHAGWVKGVALGGGSNRIAQKLADQRVLKPVVRDSERVGSGGSRILPGQVADFS